MDSSSVVEIGGIGQPGPVGLVEDSDLLSREAFLTLLVEQLKNQDPLNPMDNQQFLSQLAELSSVEQLQSMNTSVHDLGFSMASNLIGREIQFSRADEGVIASGTVESVSIQQDRIVLSVEGESVRIEDVRFVGPMHHQESFEPSTNEGESSHE